MIEAIVGIVDKVLGRVIPDKGEAARMSQEITLGLLAQQKEIFTAAAGVVTTEAASAHWLTAAWRPITMLVFVAIVANNYILAPYLGWIFGKALVLEVPPDLWELIKIGLGGYVVGRSLEKTAEAWRAK